MVLSLGSNQIIVTLTELVTLENPEFVLIIVNDSSNKKVACKLGTELSQFTGRYNKFNLTVKTDPNPLSAEISLVNPGDHKYYIYEIEDADSFDFENVNSLDLDTMDGQVERGICKFTQTPPVVKYYKNNKESVKTYGS